jgi:predicted lipoprotein with Yx(FWY)xxD motif
VFKIEGSRMPRVLKAVRARGGRFTASLVIAGLAVVAVAGLAVAKSFTLKVTKNVHVTNDPTKSFRVKAVNTHEAVAVGPSGYAVYTFQGETTHHLICKKTTNASTNCWAFWPPVSVKSAKGLSAQTGIKGKLGTFINHGTRQVTLGGKPLYYFTPDIQGGNKKQATGDELKTFGSIWHIVTVGKSQSTNNPPPMQGGLPPGY